VDPDARDLEAVHPASLITPVVMLVIWLLLYSTFKSVRLSLLIFLAVPVAASGGILAPALSHLTWSLLMLRYLPPLFPAPRRPGITRD